MALICMAVYDTEENGRSEYTERTIKSLSQTVDWSRHRLVIIDNSSCEETKNKLSNLKAISNTALAGNFGYRILGVTIITLSENIGTARAINMGIKLRNPGEHIIKIDNDVEIYSSGWVDEMEEVIQRDQTIGIVGLKRKDLAQYPTNPDLTFKSELRMLNHVPGQRWIVVEECADIMGTCTMLSSKLLDTIGGFAQPLCYAFDDTLMSLRAGLAGFKKCFLPHIEIDHIDTGANPYSQEKVKIANDAWPEYHVWHDAYCTGKRSLYEQI
jgi:GT2 family glycosyltransferase